MSLRVGFLGHGFMGTAHANALARLPTFFPDAPSVERAVLIGRDETSLATNADRLGFAETATDWRMALTDIDVLYNLAPNYLHAEPSIAALERGIHVLCEKPLASSLEAAERMAAAAEGSDALAGVGFNYRFVPALQYARSLVGELGDIRQVRSRYLQDWLVDPEEPWSWRNDADLAGSGALGDLGAHLVDLIHFLVADRAGTLNRVSGDLRTFVEHRPTEDGTETRSVTADDACTALIRLEHGAIATMEASRVASGHKNDLGVAIHGANGSVRFSLERLNEIEVLRGDQRGYERVMVTEASDPYVDAWWPPGHVLGWEHTFVHESFEFLEAIEAGHDFEPTFDDGLAVQRVLDAIERSSRTGAWTTV